MFTYVLNIPRLTKWNYRQYNTFAAAERKRHLTELEADVAGIYKKLSIRTNNHECQIIEGFSADSTIPDYCLRHLEIDMLCMSTHGASGVRKIFGTHAANMVAQANIPVFVIPQTYRMRPITKILYASDLEHTDKELEKAAEWAASFNAALELIHIVPDGEPLPNKGLFETALCEKINYPLQLHFPAQDEMRSMSANLSLQMRHLKPSLAIFFTAQDRGFLEKLFLTSKTVNVTYDAPVPLLVFPKHHTHPASAIPGKPSPGQQVKRNAQANHH